MAKPTSEKCRLCAKLSVAEALTKHGSQGTNCWEGDRCHKRRTYYRNRDRYNQHKREHYRQAMGKEPVTVAIAPPVVVYAVLKLYRARVDAPLHAVGAELWQGECKLAVIETVHTLGWKPAQIQAYLHEILRVFSEQGVGKVLEKFELQQELSPDCCPIPGCLLRG